MKTLMARVRILSSLEVILGVDAALIDTSLDQVVAMKMATPKEMGNMSGQFIVYFFSQKHILSACCVPGRHCRY